MKYYLISGEASGDLHGSNLIRQIKKLDPDAGFRCFGGDLMKNEGAVLVKHYREMAFMGVWEVLKNLKTINKNLALCKQDILKYEPQALILIDYAGFNLRIAEYIKDKGIPVFYYIPPKVWAWKKSRVKKLIAFTNKVFSILPFEKEFFSKHKLNVEYVGNPLVDAIKARGDKEISFSSFCKKNNLEDKPVIAFLAGSREQEIVRCLQEMISATKDLKGYQFVIAGVSSLKKELYDSIISTHNIHLIFDQTYDLLDNSEAAVVTSGTATLETAIFNIPQVVIYKTSPATFIIARPFVHIKFFSLVNLIMDDEVVKEYFQFDLKNKIRTELTRILDDNDYRKNMLKNYEALRKKLGDPGTSERVAKQIVQYITSHD